MSLHGTETGMHGNPAKEAQAEESLRLDQGGTPSPEQGTPEIDEAKQYSGKEVRAILSADGRTQKDRADKAEASLKLISGEHETLKTQFTTVSGQVSQLLKASDDAEAEKVQDDPGALTSLRARQSNRAETLRLEGVDAANKARETKLTEREQAISSKETSINIKLAAMTAGVDEKQLADFVPDGNPERLKKAANILKLSGTAEIDPTTGALRPAALRRKPPSATSALGGPSDLTPDEKIQRGLDQKKK